MRAIVTRDASGGIFSTASAYLLRAREAFVVQYAALYVHDSLPDMTTTGCFVSQILQCF